jgi:hypothetical protein
MGVLSIVDQIEFRWQPGRDMSPFAWSFTDDRTVSFWSGRLLGIFRPAIPNPAQGVPETSFFYYAPGDGHAALIWRHYEAGASRLQDDAARRPLVARALVGAAGVLTPDLAIAACRNSPLARFGPPPGQASSVQGLPPLRGEHLAAEPATIRALDQAACQERGLDALIAGALEYPEMPLSVLLPGREMLALPKDSAQLLLLWGLWRATAPLVTVTGARQAARAGRGWSFSTYEPPLGATGTGVLPDVVFRCQEQQGQPPMNARPEKVILPRLAGGPTAGGFPGFGERLARAYRELGGAELDRLLHQVAADSPDVDERLQLASKRLNLILRGPAAAGLERTSAESASPNPYWESLSVEPGWEPAASYPPDTATGASALVPPRPVPSRPPAPAHAGGPYANLGAAPDSPDWAAEDPAAPAAEAPQHWQDEAEAAPMPLSLIMDRLDAGSDNPSFALAHDALRKRLTDPSPSERAAARRRLANCSWYIPALARTEPFKIEETLQHLFAIAVIPDIDQPEVAGELARWAESSPPEVIRGLCAAAYFDSPETAQRLSRTLQPTLSHRWLRERGIHSGPSDGPGDEQPQPARHSGGPPRAHWLLFLQNQPNAGVLASVLAWVCLVLFVIVVLASWRI